MLAVRGRLVIGVSVVCFVTVVVVDARVILLGTVGMVELFKGVAVVFVFLVGICVVSVIMLVLFGFVVVILLDGPTDVVVLLIVVELSDVVETVVTNEEALSGLSVASGYDVIVVYCVDVLVEVVVFVCKLLFAWVDVALCGKMDVVDVDSVVVCGGDLVVVDDLFSNVTDPEIFVVVVVSVDVDVEKMSGVTVTGIVVVVVLDEPVDDL